MSQASASRPLWRSLPRPAPQLGFGIAAIAALTAVAVKTGGGLGIGGTTVVEVLLQLGGGVAAALALLAGPGRRAWGATTVALFGLLALLTLASISWSVEPSESWLETSRTAAWLGAFVIGVVMARLAGSWWESLLLALVGFAVVMSAYALLTKVAPSSLAADEIYARLRQPYSYWNSVGLTAALGIPGCLWLVCRRDAHSAIGALAYPATALLATAVLLSYSRGALLAAAIGVAFWFIFLPHRLRAAAALITGIAAAAALSLYAFGRDALTVDRVRIDLRTTAGLDFGVALAVMLVLVLLAGLAIEFAVARRSPGAKARYRVGATLIVILALIPVAFAGKVATSDRGLGGSISHAWTTVTDPNANTRVLNDPSRLTAVGSVRTRYWDEAIHVFKAHPWTGVGAGGYFEARTRYRTDALAVRHAHGYLAQTAADLGVFGLLASLALLVAWLGASGRTLGFTTPYGRSPRTAPHAFTDERKAMFALGAMVLTFGIHSLVDWTWFVPGNAIVAMLCAGWLAGRGPLSEPPSFPSAVRHPVLANLRDPLRIGAVTLVLLTVATIAWATVQPWRSFHASNAALSSLDKAGSDASALNDARDHALKARDLDPLSVEPLFELATIETAAGRLQSARGWYQAAVKLQPANADTWLQFAQFELTSADDPQAALNLLRPALFLDPHSSVAASLRQQITDRAAAVPAP